MIELVICSGKGGTGKTSVVAGLTALAGRAVLADCDVDAANLHLVLAPTTETTTPFIAGHLAAIRADDCANCGECWSACLFDAIDHEIDSNGVETYRVDPVACEGCGVCVYVCPHDVIDFPDRRCGEWCLSQTRFGPLVHAALDVGAENSGKLVSLVREEARKVARASGLDLVLIDGPPGIGCPVTASLSGVDLTLLVTEPSLSGLHDLERVLDLATHFDVPALVCINKWDLAPSLSDSIEDSCLDRGVPVIGRIPYEPLVTEAQIAGQSLVEFAPECAASGALASIWKRIEHEIADLAIKKGPPCASPSP